jgi:large exoprotein involved in heme utilization and adhesion
MGIRSYTFGSGNSGNVTLNATLIDLFGGSATLVLVELRTLGSGDAGALSVNTARLVMDMAGLINNVNNGTGNAGRININASESVVMGERASNDSALITSSTVSANGNAGEITITTPSLTMNGGARISSSTYGSGNAGRITINASEQVAMAGEGFNPVFRTVSPTRIITEGILLSSQLRSFFGLPDTVSGSGGGIVLNTNVLSVTDQAKISASHDDRGNGGSIGINANRVLLTNEGRLLSSTQSGNGGNIQLNLSELLFMRYGGLIDTESMGIGNGGNIIISAPVIAGFDNSDIVANAVSGDGGNIQINTQGIVGLEFRDQLTPENDITASSQFGVSGTVAINDFGIDPNAGLVELNAGLADASDEVAQSCLANSDNEFIATGRGGMPVNPTELMHRTTTWADTRDLSDFLSSTTDPTPLPPLLSHTPTLIEATTWRTNANGEVELFAATPTPPDLSTHATCATPTIVSQTSS